MDAMADIDPEAFEHAISGAKAEGRRTTDDGAP